MDRQKQLRIGGRAPRARPVLLLWPNSVELPERVKHRELQRDRSLAAWHRTFAGRRQQH